MRERWLWPLRGVITQKRVCLCWCSVGLWYNPAAMDDIPKPDLARRRFLTTAATVVGGAGAVVAAVPFLSMMAPSARTRLVGGPVEVDLRGMLPGEQRTVTWRGRPIWVLRRTRAVVEALGTIESALSDPASERDQQPDYARNTHRSIRPGYLVLEGSCTHLGCVPRYVRPDEVVKGLPEAWVGGFQCACHGSHFDLAGRVYEGSPAQPFNLRVPPHKFLSDSYLVIGVDAEA